MDPRVAVPVGLLVLLAMAAGGTAQGYLQKITFPAPRSASNYAKLGTTLAQDLGSFTLCLQMRTDMSSTTKAGLVSYAVQGQANELLVFTNGGSEFHYWVGGKRLALGALPVWDGERHAICVTWRSTGGAWQVYTDGVLQASGSGLKAGGKVRSGGVWILGQEQDKVGGGFDPNQAFSGELSQVNLWDRVLTAAEIGTDVCGQHGNVIDWETTAINVFGQATSAKYRCSYLQKITFPAPRSASNYAKLGTTLAQDLGSFTLCLQMRTDMSSTTKASLVSYAVQGQANELLVFTNGGSEFHYWVGGKRLALGALPVWDGERHAICVTWRSTGGAWQVYMDGTLKKSGLRLNLGGKVRSGGTWILAQDQDKVGGGFDPNQAFSGELSQVNLWDRVLTAAEIGTGPCGQHGNVIDWETTAINVFGQATSDEYRCGYLQKITFPAPRSASNYAKLGTTLAQDLGSFTLCLQMRTDMSSTTKASLVSYAVQGQANELLVFTNGGSEFHYWVGGKRLAFGALPVWDGERHAICVTWRSTGGAWQVYTDGVLQASGSGLNVGGKVRSGGVWILGQEQDKVGGGFDPNQAFSGELSQVNLWDRVLTAAEIGTDVCGQHGNVIDWETTAINVFGQATSAKYRCSYLQKITFPAPRSASYYAKLGTTLAQDLGSFTLCLQMRTDMSSTSHAGVVSYAVQGQHNELLIFNNGGRGFVYWVGGKRIAFGALPVWDGERHAICVTWRSTGGAWQVYMDGTLKKSGLRLNLGGKVRSGGTWILGQDQDKVGGGFDPNQAFSGELSQVNLWDRVLTAAEIGTDVCGQHGNVIDWETTAINVFGQATSAKYRCSYLQKITFPAPRSASNYAKLGTTLAQDLGSFTLCLQMRTDMSSTTKAGLVSYAVQGQANELLVFTNGGSEFHYWVGGKRLALGALPVWDGERHAICVTWRSTGGAWQVYTDGVLQASGSGLKAGGKVRSGGVWILGQEQDTVGGGFDPNQAFSGELSQVNLWDRVLTAAEIGTGPCGQHGNVIDWETTAINVFGQATSDEYRCA
ncbi:uncharacterized protein LOC144872277 [Branchiostoma floridae x Branchiostoma japonicum]